MSGAPRPASVRPEGKDGEGRGAVATLPEAERKPVFLRTVYPLNPGSPHYLDFPQGER